MELGDRIRQARIYKEMTQKELAERVGVLQRYISRFELNEVKPSNEELLKIADVLDINVTALISLKDNTPGDEEELMALFIHFNKTERAKLLDYAKYIKYSRK